MVNILKPSSIMHEYILNDGQYLGQTIKSYTTDMLSVKSTLHEKSESKFHAHNNSYLSILLSGRYSEMTLETRDIIFPSTIIYRPAHYKHKNQFITAKTKCLNIAFRPEWFDKLDINPEKIKFQIKSIQNYPLILRLLIDFLKYHRIDFFEELLLNIITSEEQGITSSRKPWLGKLIRILDNEIEERHSLKTLSERVFVHPNYMSRVFREHFGVTVGQYQIARKLQCATEKLFTEKSSIALIASECGFFDESHFIKTFKTCNRITPHQFRILLNS